MKSVAFVLAISLIIPSAAFAKGSQIHAFIGADQMRVKATASEMTWSSNLEGIQINDNRIESSDTFMLHCGSDGREYVMVSLPADNDIWPSQSDDFRTKTDIAAFGSDLEITDVDLLTMKVGGERAMYVNLEGKVSEFVRHWGSGMAVRVSVRPGSGLNDLSFIVAASALGDIAREEIAKAAALCQLVAN